MGREYGFQECCYYGTKTIFLTDDDLAIKQRLGRIQKPNSFQPCCMMLYSLHQDILPSLRNKCPIGETKITSVNNSIESIDD